MEEDRNAYLQDRNCFKQKCAEKKAEYQAMKLDDLISSVNDQKSLWSKLKKMTNKFVRAGNISNEEWERHFELLFNEGVDAGEVINDDRFYDDVNLDDVQAQIIMRK